MDRNQVIIAMVSISIIIINNNSRKVYQDKDE
jgi:hypothetical protein